MFNNYNRYLNCSFKFLIQKNSLIDLLYGEYRSVKNTWAKQVVFTSHLLNSIFFRVVTSYLPKYRFPDFSEKTQTGICRYPPCLRPIVSWNDWALSNCPPLHRKWNFSAMIARVPLFSHYKALSHRTRW